MMKPARSMYLERPPCEKCTTPTNLFRRSLHPSLGANFELVSYQCPACEHIQSTVVRIEQ
jgi:hypothetical protein